MMVVKAKPKLYLESVGKRACTMGYLRQGLEVWSWPVKILSDFKAHAWIDKTLEMIQLDQFATEVIFKPESVVVVYAHPLFRIEQIIFTPIDLPASFLIYKFNSFVDLDLIFSFKPELNLMWPGSIGGQYCHWWDEINGFLMSEPTDTFSAIVRAPGAARFSKEGDHAFAESSYTFKVHVEAGQRELPVSVIGGMLDRKSCRELLNMEGQIDQEMRKAEAYYREYINDTLSLETPDDELNEFFMWAKLSILKGLVRNPLLGEALVAGIGPSGKSTRPGFAWFFAADASINSLAMATYGDLETVRRTLEFYASYQSLEGRIPHELSQSHGLIDWFGKYKGFAYLHADTTAWFLLACAYYVTVSGDIDFLTRMKDRILKAVEFYEHLCDETGMVENLKAGLGALEISEFRRPKYEIYTNGIYVACLEALKRVFSRMKDEATCEKLEVKVCKVKKSMEKFFWNESESSYFLSMNAAGELFRYLTPWPSFPIAFRVLDENRSKRFMQKLLNSSVMTRWGARSIEVCEHYDPINYNLGSVWYFINGFVAKAALETDQSIHGWQIIKAAVKAFFEEGSTHLSELFSGDVFVPVTTAVPHQLFSIGPVLWSLLTGVFGLEIDGFENVLRIRPRVPVHWTHFVIDKLKVGKARLRIEYRRKGKNCTFIFKNLANEPVNVELSLDRPKFGEIMTSGGWIQSEGEHTVTFVLESEKRTDYTLDGVDCSLEYSNLSFGLVQSKPAFIETKADSDSLCLSLKNCSNTVIHVFCPEGYKLTMEPFIDTEKLEEDLYRIHTSGTENLILRFAKK